MNLRVGAEEAPHASSRTASLENDPQEWRAFRQGNIALIHSAPTGESVFLFQIAIARSVSDEAICFSDKWMASLSLAITASVPRMDLFHRRELLGAGGSLVGRLPGLVGHAIDRLPALVLAHGRALGFGFLLEPVGQAVAAEAREIHQIDILNVGTRAQMLDKAPKDGGFKFRSGFVVNRHGLISLFCGMIRNGGQRFSPQFAPRSCTS